MSQQLRARTSDGKLACLFDLGLEKDFVALLPHLCDESLAWQDGASESDLDVLDHAESLHNVFSAESEKAQTVQDRDLETTNLAKFGVDV